MSRSCRTMSFSTIGIILNISCEIVHKQSLGTLANLDLPHLVVSLTFTDGTMWISDFPLDDHRCTYVTTLDTHKGDKIPASERPIASQNELPFQDTPPIPSRSQGILARPFSEIR
jgi:hypothetical protein